MWETSANSGRDRPLGEQSSLVSSFLREMRSTPRTKVSHLAVFCQRPDGGVVTQRTANPCTPVRFRLGPPSFHSIAIPTQRPDSAAKNCKRGRRRSFVMAGLRRSVFLFLACLGAIGTAQAKPAAATVDPSLYGSLHWRLLGPFRAGWASMIEGVPDRPDTYYFGAAGGGVWRTDDAGRTWRSIFDRGGSSAIGAIAVAPSRPGTIYVGGGQPEPRYDVEAGRGVYRSTDGGKTWSDLGLADTRYIGAIWVSPTDPDTVLVAAVGHFFGPSEARGVFRSTDGGRTWSHPLAPGPWTGAVDLTSDPARP